MRFPAWLIGVQNNKDGALNLKQLGTPLDAASDAAATAYEQRDGLPELQRPTSSIATLYAMASDDDQPCRERVTAVHLH